MSTKSILKHVERTLKEIDEVSSAPTTKYGAYIPLPAEMNTLWSDLCNDHPDPDAVYRKILRVAAKAIRLAKFCTGE